MCDVGKLCFSLLPLSCQLLHIVFGIFVGQLLFPSVVSLILIISTHYWIITNWKRIINESWSDISDISKSLSVELAATVVKLQGTAHIQWILSNGLLDGSSWTLWKITCVDVELWPRLVWISLDQTYKKNSPSSGTFVFNSLIKAAVNSRTF